MHKVQAWTAPGILPKLSRAAKKMNEKEPTVQHLSWRTGSQVGCIHNNKSKNKEHRGRPALVPPTWITMS